jgi:hypothetical protein
MYTHVSKCKNDKIKGKEKNTKREKGDLASIAGGEEYLLDNTLEAYGSCR